MFAYFSLNMARLLEIPIERVVIVPLLRRISSIKGRPVVRVQIPPVLEPFHKVWISDEMAPKTKQVSCIGLHL